MTVDQRQAWFEHAVSVLRPQLLPHLHQANELLLFNFPPPPTLTAASSSGPALPPVPLDPPFLMFQFVELLLIAVVSRVKLNSGNVGRKRPFTLSSNPFFESVRQTAVVILLDECQYMSDASWNLTGRICQAIHSRKLTGVSVVLATRSLDHPLTKPRFSAPPPEYFTIRDHCAKFKTVLLPFSSAQTMKLVVDHMEAREYRCV
jgi:hypothetical protein